MKTLGEKPNISVFYLSEWNSNLIWIDQNGVKQEIETGLNENIKNNYYDLEKGNYWKLVSKEEAQESTDKYLFDEEKTKIETKHNNNIGLTQVFLKDSLTLPNLGLKNQQALHTKYLMT